MENELVNIDSVFQERMATHEEPMSRGAWNRMQHRLDEAMPQKRRPLFFIKRFFAIMILLSLSLVGARKIMDQNTSVANKSISSAQIETASYATNRDQSTNYAKSNIVQSAEPKTTTDIINDNPTKKFVEANSDIENKTSSISSINQNSNIENTVTISAKKRLHKKNSSEKNASPEIAKANIETIDAPQITDPKSSNSKRETNLSTEIAKDNNQVKSTLSSTNKLINKNIPIYSNTVYYKNNVDTLSYVIKRDTITKIFIKQRYAYSILSGRKELYSDSFIEKTTIDRKVYASQTNALALGKPTYKDAEHSIEELSSKRIATKTSSWNPSNFMNWMTQAKMNLANTQPNYAFLFGINGANNGSNTFAGFHLGLSGQIALGANCLLTADFRYLMKMNSGFAFQFMNRQISCNDSVAFQTGSPAVTMMSYNKLIDSTTKIYNFNTLHTIEVPFSIQYNYKRWSALLGLSIAYNFKLRTSEINNSSIKSQRDTLLPGSFVPSTINTIIPVSDFASKLNINYLLGVQYHVSPMIYLDVRMVKTISTSAKSAGALQVYDQVYKMPTFELSLGYYFRKKN
ncbi:MAG: hypothetical protein EBR55_10045 [Chitinophagia bacterium]|nr:hypothetical protein [Chitinophagia bacterium]